MGVKGGTLPPALSTDTALAMGSNLMLRRLPIGIPLSLVLGLMLFSALWAGERKPVKPTARDKCPVCGMFVGKYPDFLAEVLFKDGTYAVFDGAKDMFKYYFDLSKYNPSRKREHIDSIYVTDYYDLTLIDGTEAFFVIGSDVFGPMGRELIPFKTEADAKGFMKDHQGKSMLRFKEVTAEVVKSLD
jgi:copper chaperone NosL